MSTSTLAAPVTYAKTSKESHDENVEFAKQNGLSYVAITGNTFPIRNVLYAMGAKWNKELKVQQIPQHRAVEAQALADKYAPKPKTPKPVVAKVAKPAPAKTEKAPVAAHNSGGNLIGRTEVVLRMIVRLEADLDAGKGTDPLLIDTFISLGAARMSIGKALKGLQGE